MGVISTEDKRYLLVLAREAIKQAVSNGRLPEPDRSTLSPALQESGASFVTLTARGQLRGCIGTLEAHQPLVYDVREHAIAAALEDYRFPPVTASEMDSISIEISILTKPTGLTYQTPEDLLNALRPGIDGVILSDGPRKATFLPQVWEQLPNPEEFLSHLCVKMGSKPDAWRENHLDVSVYQVEEFHE